MNKCLCILGPSCFFALSLAGCGQGASDTMSSGSEPSGAVNTAPITSTGSPETLRPAAAASSSGENPEDNAAGGTAAGAAGIEAPAGADGGVGGVGGGGETAPDDADAGGDASGGDGALPPTVNGATCNIVNDTIVVAEGGFCILTEQQQAIYRLSGFDEVSCNQGRVTSGFTSGGQINLNGLQMRCEA